MNRSATNKYIGVDYRTASGEKWFVGLRENLTSDNYIIYNANTLSDSLTLNLSTNAATFVGAITGSNYSGTHSGTSSGTNTGDQTTITGNAGTATTAVSSQYVDYLPGRTDGTAYPILWGTSQGTNPTTGNARTYGFSCAAVTITSSTGTINATAFVGGGSGLTSLPSNTALYPTLNQNTTGTASNITAYTINQSVGTGNQPTFNGIVLSGPIYRNAAGTGYLNGQYSSVESTTTTGPIYTIGGTYVPTSTSLNNMYGIGYTHTSFGAAPGASTGWGMYVCDSGGVSVWLGSRGNNSVFATNVLPSANNSYSLGNSTYAWSNIYTNDLHLSNMTKEGGNDVDGTNGNWTIQEGAENLYIINNNNGKKYKISLEEV